MKNSLMSKHIKKYLIHCEDNIINLTESSSNSCEIDKDLSNTNPENEL